MLTKQIAKLFRDVYFGGNWTASNLKDNLAGIDWQQATTKVSSFVPPNLFKLTIPKFGDRVVK